ncbi:hypothetical protein KIPB_012294, partial [Kipferlia bialata]
AMLERERNTSYHADSVAYMQTLSKAKSGLELGDEDDVFDQIKEEDMEAKMEASMRKLGKKGKGKEGEGDKPKRRGRKCPTCEAVQSGSVTVAASSVACLLTPTHRQLVPGHITIVPREHCRNMADVSMGVAEGVRALMKSVAGVARQAKAQDSVLFIEASCEGHALMHCIPIPVHHLQEIKGHLAREMSEGRNRVRQVSQGIRTVGESVSGDVDYVWVQFGFTTLGGLVGVIQQDTPFPLSRVMDVIGSVLGLDVFQRRRPELTQEGRERVTRTLAPFYKGVE